MAAGRASLSSPVSSPPVAVWASAVRVRRTPGAGMPPGPFGPPQAPAAPVSCWWRLISASAACALYLRERIAPRLRRSSVAAKALLDV